MRHCEALRSNLVWLARDCFVAEPPRNDRGCVIARLCEAIWSGGREIASSQSLFAMTTRTKIAGVATAKMIELAYNLMVPQASVLEIIEPVNAFTL